MSSIPPNMNLAGALAQTQVSGDVAAKTQNAERNKRARDARELAKLATQQQHEVENTEEAEGLRVHREGEGDNAGQNLQDTYESSDEDKGEDSPLYHPPKPASQNPTPKSPSPNDPPPPPPSHIDFSA